jgi:transposase InsO family protein
MKMLKILRISHSKYYTWKNRTGLENTHNGKIPKQHWLTPVEVKAIINYAKSNVGKNIYYLRDGYRRIAYSGIDAGLFAASPSSVYRVLKEAGLLNKWADKKTTSKGTGFKQPASPHKEWHTDIKYVNYHGTFLFFLGVIDGYSRYIIHHELLLSMTVLDVEITIQRAHEKFPDVKPTLISDNGGQYISKDFAKYMQNLEFKHVRTSPNYPQSNGKIERFHRSLNEECLDKRSLIDVEDARKQVAEYIYKYNNERLHSSLNYLRPVDYLLGNPDELLKERRRKIYEAVEKRIKYWEENKYVG